MELEDTYHLTLYSHPYTEDAFAANLDTLHCRIRELDNSPVLLLDIHAFVNSKVSTQFSKDLPRP